MSALETRAPDEAALGEAPVPPLRFRGRALLIGVVLLCLQTVLIVRTNLFFARYISASSLAEVTIFLFFPLCVLNRVVHQRRAHAALSTAELAVIFTMLLTTAAIPQASLCENVVSNVVTPTYFASDANHWQALFLSRVPPWLHLTDRGLAKSFYNGLPRGAAIPWRPWIGPLLGWTVFVGLIVTAFAALAVIFYRQWNDHERIRFPLVILPLELIKGGAGGAAPLWSSRYFWLGVALPAVSLILADLHTYYPTMPEGQQIYAYTLQNLAGPPWQALNGWTFSVWSIVVGIAYFLASDVSLSIWAFHLLFWAQLVVMSALGLDTANAGGSTVQDPLQIIHWQEFGGSLMLSLVLLHNLRRTCRREGWPRPALTTFACANLGLLIWGLAAGASLWIILVFLLLLYLIVLPLARLVAAGGLYLVDNGSLPQALIYTLLGGRLSAGDHFVTAGMETVYGRADMNPSYFILNAMKVAEENRVPGVKLGALLVCSALFVYCLGNGLIIQLCYRYGALHFPCYPLTYNAWAHLRTMASALQSPPPAQPHALAWIGGGAAVVFLLTALQYRSAGLALNPIGFIVASSWNLTNQIWSSVMIGWLASVLIRRYGGLRMYRAFQPFFLGLIVGDMTFDTLTAIVDMLTGVRGAGA